MIEVIEFTPITDKKNLIGEVTVRLPKMNNFIIRRIKVLQKEDKRWVQWANFPREAEAGQVWLPFCQWEDNNMNTSFFNIVREKVKDFISNKQEQVVPFIPDEMELPF